MSSLNSIIAQKSGQLECSQRLEVFKSLHQEKIKPAIRAKEFQLVDSLFAPFVQSPCGFNNFEYITGVMYPYWAFLFEGKGLKGQVIEEIERRADAIEFEGLDSAYAFLNNYAALLALRNSELSKMKFRLLKVIDNPAIQLPRAYRQMYVSLSNYGLYYEWTGLNDQALKIYLEVLNVLENLEEKDIGFQISTTIKISELLYGMSRGDEADQYIEESLQLIQNHEGYQKYLEDIKSMQYIGLVKSRRYAEANELLLQFYPDYLEKTKTDYDLVFSIIAMLGQSERKSEALLVWKNLQNHFTEHRKLQPLHYYMLRLQLVKLEHDLETNAEEANLLILEAINILQANIANLRAEDPNTLPKALERLKNYGEIILEEAAKRAYDVEIMKSVFTLMTQLKGLSFELVLQRKKAIAANSSDQVQKINARIAELMGELGQYYLNKKADASMIKKYTEEIMGLEIQLSKAIWSNGDQKEHLSKPESILLALEEKDSYIEYYVSSRRNRKKQIYCFVLNQSIGIQLLNLDSVDWILDEAKKDIQPGSKSYITHAATNKLLYDLIWAAPLTYHAGGKVYLTNDKLLNNLQMDILSPNGKINERISQRLEIHHTFSFRSVPKFTANDRLSFPELRKGLIIGGLNYRCSENERYVVSNAQLRGDGQHFDFLPGSLKEVEVLSQFFNSLTVKTEHITGCEGQKPKIKGALGDTTLRFCHISTHGIYRAPAEIKKDESQLLAYPGYASALLVSSSESEQASEQYAYLTYYDIALSDLSHLSFAVLSSCQTGLGVDEFGEGNFSIGRGFLQAGCNAIVSTLWEIPDEFTAQFCIKFYENLSKTNSIHKALKETKNAFSATYPPYFWAGFQLMM